MLEDCINEIYRKYLHSTMVRFIIGSDTKHGGKISRFTFHYGQIYYFCFLLLFFPFVKFTFHYGQIYYKLFPLINQELTKIYIPLWLDLLLKLKRINRFCIVLFTFHYGQIYYAISVICPRGIPPYLHSTMVRFIIWEIPAMYKDEVDLHSTMVRFIICVPRGWLTRAFLFTFHYGQIYYAVNVIIPVSQIIIYIPLWLDLLFARALDDETIKKNLHSTMVRFIIRLSYISKVVKSIFTFHYGQIYYSEH